MEFKVEQFTSNAALRANVATALAVDANDPTVDTVITNVFNNHQADLASAVSVDSAVTVLASFAAAEAAASAVSTKPAVIGKTNETAPATTKKGNGVILLDSDVAIGEAIIKDSEDNATINRQNTKLVGILTRKPAVPERLGDITEMHINTSPSIKKKLFEEYTAVAGQEQKFEEIKNLFTTAEANPDTTVKIAINKNARPVIEAYRFETTNAGQVAHEDIKKTGGALRVYVATKFAGQLPEAVGADGKSTMGVFLRAATSDTTKLTKVSAVVTGAKDYWALNADGIKTYEEVSGDFDTINVRSDISCKIKDKGGNERTYRLSGRVQVPKIKRMASFVNQFGEISQGVGSGGVTAAAADKAAVNTAAAKLIAEIASSKDGNSALLNDTVVGAALKSALDKFKASKEGAAKSTSADNR